MEKISIYTILDEFIKLDLDEIKLNVHDKNDVIQVKVFNQFNNTIKIVDVIKPDDLYKVVILFRSKRDVEAATKILTKRLKKL